MHSHQTTIFGSTHKFIYLLFVKTARLALQNLFSNSPLNSMSVCSFKMNSVEKNWNSNIDAAAAAAVVHKEQKCVEWKFMTNFCGFARSEAVKEEENLLERNDCLWLPNDLMAFLKKSLLALEEHFRIKKCACLCHYIFKLQFLLHF